MTPEFLNPAVWGFTQDKVLLWLLVVTRFSGLFAVLPGLGAERIPLQVRAALVMLTAAIIAPIVPRPAPMPSGLWDLLPTLGGEFLTGMLMGLVVAWIFDAVAFGGQLMDTQMGFAFVQLVDPSSAQPTSISGAVLLQITLLFLFLSGLHHQMILALVESYRILPIGGAIPMRPLPLVLLAGQILSRGLQLAMPVLITLFFVDVVEGIAAKIMPQLQLMQLAFPIKISVGLAVLAIILREFTAWILPLFERAPREALRMLG